MHGASISLFYFHRQTLLRHIIAHVHAKPLKPSRLGTDGTAFQSNHYHNAAKSEMGFHIVFFELTRVPEGTGGGDTPESQNTVPLYGDIGEARRHLRKSSFTVLVLYTGYLLLALWWRAEG